MVVDGVVGQQRADAHAGEASTPRARSRWRARGSIRRRHAGPAAPAPRRHRCSLPGERHPLGADSMLQPARRHRLRSGWAGWPRERHAPPALRPLRARHLHHPIESAYGWYKRSMELSASKIATCINAYGRVANTVGGFAPGMPMVVCRRRFHSMTTSESWANARFGSPKSARSAKAVQKVRGLCMGYRPFV